jgi:hypothetical protein
VGVRLAACLAAGLLSAATAILSGHEWMHSSGPGPSNRQRSRGLPGMQQPKVRALLVAATLLPVVGLHPAQRQRGCREQRGWVSRRQNAAEVVAEQLVRDLHP